MKTVVYRHIRLDTNQVFYIGIGTEKRPYSLNGRNTHWSKIVKKTDYRVDILFDDLTWEECCEKEKELISLYGRKDLGLGTLVNMTDGGEGNLGLIFSEEHKKKISESQKGKTIPGEIRRKMSESHKGKTLTEEHKLKMRKPKSEEHKLKMRKPKSKEHKRKLSESKKGKTLTEEHKLKMRKPKSEEHKLKLSESKKGKKRKPFTEEHRRKLSESKKGRKKLQKDFSKQLEY
jgi:hypothetical protein